MTEKAKIHWGEKNLSKIVSHHFAHRPKRPRDLEVTLRYQRPEDRGIAGSSRVREKTRCQAEKLFARRPRQYWSWRVIRAASPAVGNLTLCCLGATMLPNHYTSNQRTTSKNRGTRVNATALFATTPLPPPLALFRPRRWLSRSSSFCPCLFCTQLLCFLWLHACPPATTTPLSICRKNRTGCILFFLIFGYISEVSSSSKW